MTELQKRMRNVAIMSGRKQTPAPSSTPSASPYTGRQRQYFAPATDAHTWDAAKYASNYYAAQVQGVIPGDFNATRGAYLRTMDLIDHSTGAELPNDWQVVYFQDSKIQGLYTGAKLEYAGNTWLCTAPRSVAESSGNATIRRCNAVWKHLDFYGNVLEEPFVWNKGPATNTANTYAAHNSLADAVQKCAMQLNEQTEQLRHNTRLMLGRSAYQLRGIIDFISDFTAPTAPNSTEQKQSEPAHILYFDLEYSEPLASIDDTERGIAGGLAFSWTIGASGPREVQQGERVSLGLFSLRSDENGQDVPVTSTAEHPISYIVTSSDYNVLDCDLDGNVTGIEPGAATVTVALAQNPGIRTEIEITVTAAATAPELIISPDLPTSLRQQRTASAEVYLMESGQRSDAPITVTGSGPASYCYTLKYEAGTLTLTCWEGSSTPLTITIKGGDLTETRTISLRNF